jgi:hypothetical protein
MAIIGPAHDVGVRGVLWCSVHKSHFTIVCRR